MACEVARSSPFSNDFIDESWGNKNPETTNLENIDEFNATFGIDSNGNNNQHGIDPQMLNNPPSPASTAFNATGMDHTLSPDPSNAAVGLGIYSDFDIQQASPGPYFHPALDLYLTAPFHHPAAGMRYPNRQRSLSEPPADMFPHHQRHAQGPPQVTFHRGGHFLGQPQAKMLKSLPKHRREALRSQPYKMKNGKMPAPDQQQQQQRYQLRRAQTQPSKPPMAPTSVPMPSPMAPHPMWHMGMGPGNSVQPVFEPLPPVMEGQKYVSSRVCTPTPEMQPRPQSMMGSTMPQQQMQIDPLLMATSPPMSANGSHAAKTVTVPLTVEELRMMITEAVQKAVKNLDGGVAQSVETGAEGTVREETAGDDRDGEENGEEASNVEEPVKR